MMCNHLRTLQIHVCKIEDWGKEWTVLPAKHLISDFLVFSQTTEMLSNMDLFKLLLLARFAILNNKI